MTNSLVAAKGLFTDLADVRAQGNAPRTGASAANRSVRGFARHRLGGCARLG